MSGPKRNPDQLNTIGVVVVGICGAVLVYVSIVALQAFYMNDTSEIQTMADYGGTDATVRSLKTGQITNINEYGSNPEPKDGKPQATQTYRIGIDRAMKLVVDGAKTDPANLVPSQGRASKEQATVKPIFGRPQPLDKPAPPADAGSGSGSAAGSAAAPAGAGSGSATAPVTPTGAGSAAAPAAAGGAGSATPNKGNAP